MSCFKKRLFLVIFVGFSHAICLSNEKALDKQFEQLDESLSSFNDFLESDTSSKSAHNSKKNMQESINRDDQLEQSAPASLMVLAEAYQQKKDYKNAARVLTKLKDKESKDLAALMDLARAFSNLYFKTGDFAHRESVVDLLNQVLEQRNKTYSEMAQLEMLKLLKFKADGTDNNYAILQLVKKLINDFGEKPHYISDLCKYLHLNKFHKQSVSACRKAINKSPDAPHNYVYYAWSFEDNKKTESHLKSAGKKFPESYFVQVQTGEFYLKQEDYIVALPYYTQAVSISTNAFEAQVGVARCFFNTEKEEESYSYFLRACKLNKSETLWSFKQAKSILNQRSKFKLAAQFEKGITECFLNTK